MKDKFIKSVMNKRNEFRVESKFIIYDTLIEIDNLKIDTGCAYTTFPFKKLGVFTEQDALNNKYLDILSNTPNNMSYGVETGGTKHKRPITAQEKMDCTAMVFTKTISEFSICGIAISCNSIKINYDRTGNLLLGMDIMKNWDIHIGTVDTGETIFLACPKDKINEEYLLELERLFHVHSLIDSTIIRQKIEQTKEQLI